jgi:cellulose synthase/poly-beta-1,6-N-acetylglucosamine synthase-like glycosyltransferase
MSTALIAGGLAVIGYVYVGYPALVTMAARIGRSRSAPVPLPVLPTVTLVIAAHNEERVLEKKLANSLALDYPADRLEILVAADGSDDGTVDVARRFQDAGVAVVHRPERRGKSAAINRAVAAARNEIVVFSDANNHYETQTLRRLVEPFADPAVGVVTGAKEVGEGDGHVAGEGVYWRYEDAIKRAESALGCCTAVAGEVTAIRRGLIEPIPPEIINDDFWLAMRAVVQGARVVYAPAARSIEPPSGDLGAERIRRTRMVAGRFQAMARSKDLLPADQPRVVWQVVSHKFLRPLVPAAMFAVLAGTVTGLRGRRRRVAVVAAAGQALFYGMAAAGGRSTGRRGLDRLLTIPRFLVSSNWAAVRGFHAYATGRATSVWTRVDRAPHD